MRVYINPVLTTLWLEINIIWRGGSRRKNNTECREILLPTRLLESLAFVCWTSGRNCLSIFLLCLDGQILPSFPVDAGSFNCIWGNSLRQLPSHCWVAWFSAKLRYHESCNKYKNAALGREGRGEKREFHITIPEQALIYPLLNYFLLVDQHANLQCSSKLIPALRALHRCIEYCNIYPALFHQIQDG